jgi:hypothetical protein
VYTGKHSGTDKMDPEGATAVCCLRQQQQQRMLRMLRGREPAAVTACLAGKIPFPAAVIVPHRGTMRTIVVGVTCLASRVPM